MHIAHPYRLLWLLVMMVAGTQPLRSQTAREEIAADVTLSGYYLTAYPGPLQDTLTPPPAGKIPFYISHYGRHGSRWMNNADTYNAPIAPLQAAESAGVLSPFGRKVLADLQAIAADAADRYEELTPVGLRQWQEIGRRMTRNFPEVFSGTKRVDARSTIYSRCILSMTGLLGELKAFNPHLQTSAQASVRDMPFLLSGYYNSSSGAPEHRTVPRHSQATAKAMPVPKVNSRRVASQLISDSAYIAQQVDTATLFNALLEVVSSVQNSEIGDSLTLYDIFTDEELYEGWRRMNVKAYNSYHKGTTAKALLQRMTDDADAAIAGGETAAHLRFGHESVLLPLICLMGIDNLDHDWATADELEAAGWRNYHLYPMAGNVQVVFYRSDASDTDVWVKILLNEREATLPLESEKAPYYRWSEVRALWRGKINEK